MPFKNQINCQRFTTRFTMKCAAAFVLLVTVVTAAPVPEGLTTINPYIQNDAEQANYFFNAQTIFVDSSEYYMSVKVNSVESSIGLFSVDFGEEGATTFRVRVGTSYLEGQRAIVNFHLDSPTRKPFATVEILNTGSWTTFVDYNGDISVPPTGVHDMYVTFATVDALDTICYIDLFQFYQ